MKSYATAYFLVYGFCLALATLVVARGAWQGLIAPSPFIAIALLLTVNLIDRWPRILELLLAVWLSWLALACFVEFRSQAVDFDRVKLLGLGMFFVTQAAVSALWVVGPQTGEAAKRWSLAAGLCGVAAFLWMVLSFGGLAPSGSSAVDTHDTQDAALLAAQQAANAYREGRR